MVSDMKEVELNMEDQHIREAKGGSLYYKSGNDITDNSVI
jgi:hypothetical protein